jgi:anti-sigma B factor antagonist
VSSGSRACGVTFIALAGELDVAAAPALRDGVTRAPGARRPDLVVDLRQVEFMDCSTISVFLATRRDLDRAGGCLRLVVYPQQVFRALELSQVQESLCLYDCVSAATEAVCRCHRT